MKEKIINYLKESTYPIRTRYIARALGVDRRSVNQILYAEKDHLFTRNDNFEWSLIHSQKQDKQEQHWAIIAMNREWVDLRKYVLNLFEEDEDLFDDVAFHYNFESKSERLKAELESYLLHFLLDIQFFDQPYYIEYEDVQELTELLSESLLYDYAAHRSSVDRLTSRFDTLDDFTSGLLLSLIRYDDKYETRKCFIFINKISTLASYMAYANDDDSDMNVRTKMIINNLINFVQANYDYFSGEVNSFVQCFECGTWIKKNDSEHDSDYDYYCSDCDYLIDDFEDEDEEEVVECYICSKSIAKEESEEDKYGNYYCSDCELYNDDEENDENIADENEFEFSVDNSLFDEVVKEEIIENCSTCNLKNLGTCNRVFLNQICDRYKYQR